MNKLIKRFSFAFTVTALLVMASIAVASSCAPYCALEAGHGASGFSSDTLAYEMSGEMSNDMIGAMSHSNHSQAMGTSAMAANSENSAENCFDEPCPSLVSGEELFSSKVNNIVDFDSFAFTNLLDSNLSLVETPSYNYRKTPITTASKLPLFIKHSSFLN